jgi:hypothetical protein
MINQNISKKVIAHRGISMNHNETLVQEKETAPRVKPANSSRNSAHRGIAMNHNETLVQDKG